MNYYEEKIFNSQLFSKLFPYETSEFINCSFELIDFSEINLSLSKFIECKFSKCNLSNVNLKNTSIRDVIFSECKLIGLNWSETQTVSTLAFQESILDFSVFQNQKLNGVLFKNCSVKEVDFYNANLSKASFSGSNLSKTTFIKANLSQADLRDAYNYDIDPKETNIKKAKFQLPEALNLLRAFDIILE
jgi:uncharacterized protein YjbI with pentapeptide repeats